MDKSEFSNGVNALIGKKIVIVGCGAQGLNQGLNMRDSGLNISYALRTSAIKEKRTSFQNATKNNFLVGDYNEMIPGADLVINLTPDKNHSSVVQNVIPMMKKNAIYYQISGKEKLGVTVFRVLHHIFFHSFQVPILILLVYHLLKQ